MQFRGSPFACRSGGSELTVEALAEGFTASVRVGGGDTVCELGDRCTLDVGAPGHVV